MIEILKNINQEKKEKKKRFQNLIVSRENRGFCERFFEINSVCTQKK